MTDRVAGIVDAVRLRLEDELRQQLAALAAEHERALETVREGTRQAVANEARQSEERWSALLAGARADAQRSVEAAVSAARAEYESELEAARRAADRAIEEGQRFREALMRCGSLTEVLDGLADEHARGAEGALFVVREGRCEAWRDGSDDGRRAALRPLAEEALRRRTPQQQGDARAVPLLLEGTPVAVLAGRPSRPEDRSLDLIASAATARLAEVVAGRVLQAERWIRPPQAGRATPTDPAERASKEREPDAEAAESARRYAQLLISEISLYNESAVREGRERRDLARRLAAEITRARQIYEARVPADLPGRAEYFHQELVRTLAGGDASLLA